MNERTPLSTAAVRSGVSAWDSRATASCVLEPANVKDASKRTHCNVRKVSVSIAAMYHTVYPQHPKIGVKISRQQDGFVAAAFRPAGSVGGAIKWRPPKGGRYINQTQIAQRYAKRC